ncbi:grasp-with-spasm system SPASM domain peptide maturase [Aureispira sp. CCB-QB1]|uniref:grasp-with-spasm system SPASM domain peptide maturase n=1 Tax=Aureispira sp. CCB-QB1 TaxID=1313421 RepID=UPI000696BF6E|nr:grasp-with-spasm system SPASM domain peptide maturase [Aureispira sp. CCB-QB1]
MKILATNCKITKGLQRACISDFQHQEFWFIPLELAAFLEYKKDYSELSKLSVDLLQKLELLDVVLEIDSSDKNFMIEIPLDFDVPYHISNAILDYNETSTYNFKNILHQLKEINCPHLEIRFYDVLDFLLLYSISEVSKNSTIESIDVYLPYETHFPYKKLEMLRANNLRFRWFFIHSVPLEFTPKKEEHQFVKHTNQVITDQGHCGAVHYFYFEPHISVFTESQHHNTCLNRKISIDTDGNIKNCPSMQQSFGHISNTTLEEVIKNPAFTKMWDIKKDDIDKCKTCEFRHICTDCRAYLENPDDLYAAPLKCGYNPETCEWEEWSTNPLKEKAIEYYQLQSIL